MAKLQLEQGGPSGKSFTVPKNKPFLIGRGEKQDIVLSDSRVSRRHCRIEYRNHLFFARDFGSVNGTFINGKRITFAALLDGDRLRVGGTVFRFLTEGRPDPLIGEEIGGYKIDALLGRGGMGTVYRARQLSIGRYVALKVLSSELAHDRDFVELFLREARAAAQLSHPNIVKVYEVGSEGGLHFFSMELMYGGTVEERLACDGPLPLREALSIARDASEGLAYAESRQLVHRDIKPGNLVLASGGTAKICDLGIAGRLNVAPEETTRGGGSPHYTAPEQALGRPVDCRADIYSLGVSLYTMLAGHPPFTGSSSREIGRKHVTEPPPPLEKEAKGLPPEVVRLVSRMLEKLPDKRPSSAVEVRDRLTRIMEQEKPAGKARRSRGNPAQLPVILTVIAVLAIAGGVFLAHRYIKTQEEKKWNHLVHSTREKAQSLLEENRFEASMELVSSFRREHKGKQGLDWVEPLLVRIKARKERFLKQKRAEDAQEQLQRMMKEGPGIEELKSFIAEYEGTGAAAKASEELKRKVAREKARKLLEKEAEEEFQRIKQKSDAYEKERNYRLADALWATFPEKYSGTSAARKAESEKQRIQKEAASFIEKRRKEAFAEARKGCLAGAQQILSYLLVRVPRRLSSRIENARGKILMLAEKVEKERQKKARKRDEQLISEANEQIEKLLQRARFTKATGRLQALRSHLTTEQAAGHVEARVQALGRLEDFFNDLCVHSFREPVEFRLSGGTQVYINRIRRSGIEYFEERGEKMAHIKEWANVKPERMVALMKKLAKTGEEVKACKTLAKELGVAHNPH